MTAIVQEDSRELRGNEHILFVDDERQVVSIAQEMLQELGYSITSYARSVEALKTNSKHKIRNTKRILLHRVKITKIQKCKRK